MALVRVPLLILRGLFVAALFVTRKYIIVAMIAKNPTTNTNGSISAKKALVSYPDV